MIKPTIVFDLDGVTVNLCSAVHHLAHQRYGIVLPFPAGHSPSFFADGWGIPEEEASLVGSLYFDEEAMRMAPPMFGAVAGLRALDDVATIVYVTARRVDHQAITQGWLVKHGIHHRAFHGATNKAELARQLGAVVSVEDAPHHLTAYAEKGITVVRFAHPYNEGSPGYPVETWGQLTALLTASLTQLQGSEEAPV